MTSSTSSVHSWAWPRVRPPFEQGQDLHDRFPLPPGLAHLRLPGAGRGRRPRRRPAAELAGHRSDDQVTSLRENRKATQTQLEQTEAAVNDRDGYITAAAAAYLPGTLDGKKVALAVLPDTESDDVEGITAQVEAAGGKISGRVSLTTAWVDPSRETFRQTYSGQFAPHLGKTTSTDGNGVLGEGLGTALTSDSESAKALMDLLTATDSPLVSVDAKPSGPADMVVVVGPHSPDAADPKSTETADSLAQTAASWATALTGTAATATTVIVGAPMLTMTWSPFCALTSPPSPRSTRSARSPQRCPPRWPWPRRPRERRGINGFDKGVDAVMPPVSR